MKVPTTISETFDAIDNLFLGALAFARNNSETEFVTQTHHTIGRRIRNDWGLWSAKSELCERFNQVGIYHPDDMSSIILTSYYRKIHDLPLELEAQIQHYIEYWKAQKLSELLEGNCFGRISLTL